MLIFIFVWTIPFTAWVVERGDEYWWMSTMSDLSELIVADTELNVIPVLTPSGGEACLSLSLFLSVCLSLLVCCKSSRVCVLEERQLEVNWKATHTQTHSTRSREGAAETGANRSTLHPPLCLFVPLCRTCSKGKRPFSCRVTPSLPWTQGSGRPWRAIPDALCRSQTTGPNPRGW